MCEKMSDKMSLLSCFSQLITKYQAIAGTEESEAGVGVIATADSSAPVSVFYGEAR